MAFGSLAEIEAYAAREHLDYWEAVAQEEAHDAQTELSGITARMEKMYLAMREADAGYEPGLHSHSGFVGGDGARMEAYVRNGEGFLGAFAGAVMASAVKMAESNACMKRIVAAPTAGSCGVLPSVLLTYEDRFGESRERMIQALFVAAGIGNVIAERSSISGARGGCQAEIGAASAMAAGALVWLRGGDAQTVNHAAALALKSLLGLVCDPVAGLVEIPCVKRNASGAVNALCAADMALAGIRSLIPPDEVIDAMREVGDALCMELRETGRGGLAATVTGRQLAEKVSAGAASLQ